MYRLIMAIGMVAATCLVFGCGSAAEESSSTPLTKAQFIKQADQICAKSAKEREAAAASFIKALPGGAADAEAHLDEGVKQVVAPSMKEEATKLAALAAPENDVAEVSRMIENLSKASEVLAEDGSKGLSGSSLPAFEGEASAYGLKICSNPY